MGKYLTFLMAYGGAFVSVFYPFIGLLVYISFAILAPESLWFWEFPEAGGRFSLVVALALLVGWAFQSFGNWQFGKAALTVASILFFMVWAAASWPMASNTD